MKVRGKGPDGQVIEVELEGDLPRGLLTEEQFQERFDRELERRMGRARRAALDEALKDDEFKGKALTAWGINLDQLAKDGELNAEKVKALRGEWERAALEPVQTELKKSQEKLGRLTGRQLEAEILAAATSVGVRKEFLRPPMEGASPLLVTALRDRFQFDPETDRFYEIDAKTGKPKLSAAGDSDYRTVAEALQRWSEDKANADYLEKRTPTGPRIQGAGGGTGKDLSHLSPEARLSEVFEGRAK
jgi:hypothetical protein